MSSPLASARLHSLLRLAVVALFVGAFAARARGLPLADEVDFMKPLERWVSHGPQKEGLWHSPFYPWLLSLLGRALGFTPAVARLPGLVSVALGAFLIHRAAIALRPEISQGSRTALLSLSLLSPLALGSALVLDYDNTLLFAATAFFFWMIVDFDRNPGRRIWRPLPTTLAFGVALGLALMAKETTPLAYPLAIAVVAWRRFGPAHATLAAAASAALGSALFLATTGLWCASYDLPLAKVFEMDLLGLHNHGGSPPDPLQALDLGARIWLLVFPVFWVSLPLTALLAVRLPRLALGSHGAVPAITATVLAVVLAYTFGLRQMTYHFPKYMMPVLPWVAFLVISAPFGEASRRPGDREGIELACPWAVGVFAWFVFAPNPMLLLHGRDTRALILHVAIVGSPVVARWIARAAGRATPTLASLALLCAVGLSLASARATLTKDYSVTYWYGDRAIQEARPLIELWRAKNPGGDLYAPAKDIAFAIRDLGGQYVWKDALGERAERLCAAQSPFLIVTRLREDSSLLTAPPLLRFRPCVSPEVRGVDIVLGAAYSRP